MSHTTQELMSRRLLRYGTILFLIGLITGFIIPAMQNPRMGLSSHLEAVMNGMLLLILGIIWPKLHLGKKALSWAFYLSLFGTYVNWLTTFLAGIWGAGAEMMPIAGGNFHGLAWQEGLISFGLISLSIAMIAVSLLVLWGLKGPGPETKAN